MFAIFTGGGGQIGILASFTGGGGQIGMFASLTGGGGQMGMFAGIANNPPMRANVTKRRTAERKSFSCIDVLPFVSRFFILLNRTRCRSVLRKSSYVRRQVVKR